MITVLTAMHNCRNFAGQCLRSLLASTFTDWEMIVLDDMSTDRTREVIRQYRDLRIKYIDTKKRLFCGSAYTLLSEHANGDLVCILDGDDAIEPTALKIVRETYDGHPEIDWLYSQHWKCNPQLRPLKLGICSLPPPGMDLLSAWEQHKHCYSHMRTCRAKMLKYGLFPRKAKFNVDKHMGYMLESHGQGAFLNLPLYRYRMYPGQVTTVYRGERTVAKEKLIAKFRTYRQEMKLTPKPIIEVHYSKWRP